MLRRTVVRLAGVGVAPLVGCLGSPGGEASRRVRIVSRDPPPDLPIEPDVSVTNAPSSAEGPPRLRASVTNQAEYPLELGEERAIVFAFVASDRRPGLILLPEPAGDYEPVRAGCWRLAEPIAIPEYYGITRLGPGETTQRELGVWAAHDANGCLPTGRFRFETTYAVARDETEGLDGPERRGGWGFDVRLE